jgi:RNA polymerase sigma factor (sigma-70 family)
VNEYPWRMDGSAANAAVAWRLAIPAPEDGTSLQTTSAIAAGDTEAFAQFYEVWFDRMYQMARSITGRDESFCLDVTQDAMLRLVRGMRPMATEDELRKWLQRVVHTAALDRLRSEARRRRRERIASEGDGSAADANGVDTALAEEIAALRAQIEALGPDDRGLLLLRFGRSATLGLAAAATGSTEGAAHGRIRRLARRLREMMEAHDES